ncbi:hypothetical protein DFJ74DRAFT_174545 [Hyaloraphidium curvatum]|nr:hypothetical protein DFJ74DRAFT_174545 [Hyaloraphidium curvatum]
MDLRNVFTKARRLYVMGRFRDLVDLTSPAELERGGQLAVDQRLASKLRKLRWQALARANLDHEEVDKLLSGVVQQPKGLAFDEIQFLLPALSPATRRRLIKNYLAAQSPAFFDRVADRAEPESRLYECLVEAYVLAPGERGQDVDGFLEVALVDQDKKRLLRKLTGKGDQPVADPSPSRELTATAKAAQEQPANERSGRSTGIAASGTRAIARPAKVPMPATSRRGQDPDTGRSEGPPVSVAVMASAGTVALLSILLRKQIWRVVLALVAALQRTLQMALTRA